MNKSDCDRNDAFATNPSLRTASPSMVMVNDELVAGEGFMTYILQVLSLLGIKWLGHLEDMLVDSAP